jgi:prepilin-type N-terminal cleavage/methylation domain-containing protein
MKKQNLKTFCILHSAFCISGNGFTLIEVLVALIIVAITLSVVLGSQLVSLKTEQKARALQLFRFETQRIFSATRRAKNEQQLMELLPTGSFCRLKSE